MRFALLTIVISCDAKCCWPKMQYHSTIKPHPRILKCGMRRMHIGQPSHQHLDQKIYRNRRIENIMHVPLRAKRPTSIATMTNQIRNNRAVVGTRLVAAIKKLPSTVSVEQLQQKKNRCDLGQLWEPFSFTNSGGQFHSKKSKRAQKTMKTTARMAAM